MSIKKYVKIASLSLLILLAFPFFVSRNTSNILPICDVNNPHGIIITINDGTMDTQRYTISDKSEVEVLKEEVSKLKLKLKTINSAIVMNVENELIKLLFSDDVELSINDCGEVYIGYKVYTANKDETAELFQLIHSIINESNVN